MIPEVIQIFLELPERVSPSEFVPIKGLSELDEGVAGDSEMWAERFFAPAANPHQAKDVRYSVSFSDGKRTADLLRYEWTVRTVALVAFETRGYVLVRIRKPVSFPLEPSQVEAVAKTVLNMSDPEHAWRLKYPAPLADGVWFSTNPDDDPDGTRSWKTRLDAAIRGGYLEFLCFKKHEQKVGLTGAGYWFGDAFRAKHGGDIRR